MISPLIVFFFTGYLVKFTIRIWNTLCVEKSNSEIASYVFDQKNQFNSNYTSRKKFLWGTFRSNLYFGMRTKTAKSLLTGIMWYSDDNLNGFKSK